MRAIRFAAAFLAALLLWSAEAAASIVVRVDKTSQVMRVVVDGELRYTWAVSTGRAGYNTPNGSYRPQRLERHWRSRKYGMAPMPHSIFFRGGYAIHGTNMVGRLGRVDSHGCIRLAPAHARTLFEMVARRRGVTRIVIEGTSPRQAPPALVAGRAGPRAAAGPARTAQMRLTAPAPRRAAAGTRPASRLAAPAAQPGRIAAPVSSGPIRTAWQATGRTTAHAVHPERARMTAPALRGDNRYFTEWFLRR